MLATAPYLDLSPFRLVGALAEQRIIVTHQVARTWASKYRTPAGGVRVETAEALEEGYGDAARQLAVGELSAYKLCGAFRRRTPRVFMSDSVAKAWLAKYGGANALREVLVAGHLELWYGDRLRAEYQGAGAGALRTWLREACSVKASERVCQAWLSRDWSSSGKLTLVGDVEYHLGERLRLEEYAVYFGDAGDVGALVDILSEGDPSYAVSELLLRQWYARYHPRSGPLSITTAEQLEQELGDEMRRVYPGMKQYALRTALGRRQKPVLVSDRACRTWVEQFGAAPVSRRAFKRPAASCVPRPPAWYKRPRVSGTVLETSAALEEACGVRYRREQIDLGLGHTWRELQQVLAEWGYTAGKRSCWEWLCKYRLGDGARDGGASVYVLARGDLRRWYHVDGLRGVELTDKYRSVYGVYSHPTPLIKWLRAPAQALQSLDNNEDYLGSILRHREMSVLIRSFVS